jgi:hypothetical protein
MSSTRRKVEQLEQLANVGRDAAVEQLPPM